MTKFFRSVFGGAGARQAGRFLAATCLAAAALSVGCGGQTQMKEFDADGEGAEVKRGINPQPDEQVAVVETEFGQIVIELYPNLAPRHVERFKTLVSRGFYDGTTFHRVNPQAGVVQGGDPNSKDADPSNDGMGGSDLPDLPAEFSDVPFDRGVVGAARSRDVNSANSQFYVTLKRVPQWDTQYTVFGKVIRGMNTADVISTAPTSANHPENPDPKVVIKSITLQPRANFQ